MRGQWLCLGVVCALIPLASAEAPLVLGTEDLPELPDAAGDVTYSPAYLGGNASYLDLTAAWWDFDNATDEVRFTFRMTSTERLAMSPSGLEASCLVTANITAEEKMVGYIQYIWTQPANHSDLETYVLYTEWDGVSATTGGEIAWIQHKFTSELGTPAYLSLAVDRAEYLSRGDAVEKPFAECRETIEPMPLRPESQRQGVDLASDRATSEAAYSFQELRRQRDPSGQEVPFEDLPAEDTLAPSSDAEPPAADQTPAIPWIAVLGMITVAAVFHRWKR